MTRYTDHEALTVDRLRNLRELAAGKRPQIQRMRLKWFVDNGYIMLGARPAASESRRRVVTRSITLTDKALAVPEVAAAAEIGRAHV